MISPRFLGRNHTISHLPVLIALVGVLVGGIFLLDRADRQARDTTRKHHLDDVERALYFARNTKGTYPPYNEPTWCGKLSDPANAAVLAEVEAALRAQHELYANPAKPFPTDPTPDAVADYFYWKRSPALFELYADLETYQTDQFATATCDNTVAHTYNYGINSRWREDRPINVL